jgi:hypothetical protein
MKGKKLDELCYQRGILSDSSLENVYVNTPELQKIVKNLHGAKERGYEPRRGYGVDVVKEADFFSSSGFELEKFYFNNINNPYSQSYFRCISVLENAGLIKKLDDCDGKIEK